MTAAGSLPEGPAAAVLDAGRSAFTDGFGVVGLVGAALLAGVVVLVLTSLRRTAA